MQYYRIVLVAMFLIMLMYILKNSSNKSTSIASIAATSSNKIEHFQKPINDILSIETQSRRGKKTVIDKLKLKEIPFVTNKYRAPDFRRFKVQLFKDTNFRNRLTLLKDDTKPFNSVQINYPIRSLIIEAVPNDIWKYCQYFSIIIYLKHNPSTRIVFHVPRDARSVYNEIPDTNKKGELLEWMTNFEPKIVIFMTNFYEPIPDLYDETFFKSGLLVPPESPLTDGQGLKNQEFPVFNFNDKYR